MFKYPLQKNQSYGSVSDSGDFHRKWIGQNGEIWEDLDYPDVYPLVLAEGTRGPQTTNAFYPIGKSKVFRPVSNWRRSGVKYSYFPGEVRYRGWGKYYNPVSGQLEDRRDELILTGTRLGAGVGEAVNKPYDIWPALLSGGVINPEYKPNMRTRVMTELLLKVGSRKASYGEAIAESRQTINHLAKTTSSVVKALLAARKGNWSGVTKALQLDRRHIAKGNSPWSQRWLEYQYAWLPLLGDVKDTMELVQKGFREEVQLMSSVRNIKDPHPPRRWPVGFEYTRPTGDGLFHYRGKVFYKVREDSLSKLNQMGLLNPFEIAWAVVPYSFVVDWFLPVGNFLEALMAPVGVDFVDGYYSISFQGKYTTHTRPAAIVGPGWWHEPVGEFRTVAEFNAYHREKLNAFPTPGLYFKSPFSTTHVVSATALLRQLLR